MPVVWGLAPTPADEPVNAVKSPPPRRRVATFAAALLGGCLAGVPAVRAAEPLPPDAMVGACRRIGGVYSREQERVVVESGGLCELIEAGLKTQRGAGP
jgi:hypothetical protein